MTPSSEDRGTSCQNGTKRHGLAWRLTSAHAWIFGVLLVVFSVLTFLLVHAGSDPGPDHWRHVAQTTAATAVGPFTGAIARDWQSCCARFSWSLAPYAGTALAAGILLQLLPFPPGRGWNRARLAAWGAGWTAWFGAGIVSFAHALE